RAASCGCRRGRRRRGIPEEVSWRFVTPSVSEGPGREGLRAARPSRPLAHARGDTERRFLHACRRRPAEGALLIENRLERDAVLLRQLADRREAAPDDLVRLA